MSVPSERMIGRTPSSSQRIDARDEALPVHVAGSEEVAAPRDAHGYAPRVEVARGDQVGARLRHVVRVAGEERHVLVVGQLGLRAVRLVAARGHDLLDPGRAAGGLEHRGGAHDVALPRRDRVLVRHAHLGLGGEVEQGPHLVLAEHPLDEELVLDGAADDRDLVAPVGNGRGGNAVAGDDHDVGAEVDELLGEVRAEEAGRAGDGDAPVTPEVGVRLPGAVSHACPRRSCSQRRARPCGPPTVTPRSRRRSRIRTRSRSTCRRSRTRRTWAGTC